MAKKGFTLVELLVVIAIILMAMFLTLPSIAKVFTQSSSGQAYHVMCMQLNAARAYAIQNSCWSVVHSQLADSTLDESLEGTTYVGAFYYDQTAKVLRPTKDLPPIKLPGYSSFGEVSSAFIDSSNNYKNMDPNTFADFTSVTVIFSPGGSTSRYLDGDTPAFDTTHSIFSGDKNMRIWATPPPKLGTFAMTMFNIADPNICNGSPKLLNDPNIQKLATDTLNKSGTFLAVNLYSGLLVDRVTGQ